MYSILLRCRGHDEATVREILTVMYVHICDLCIPSIMCGYHSLLNLKTYIELNIYTGL